MQYFYKASRAKSVLRIPVPHNNHEPVMSVRQVVACPLNGLIEAAVAVAFVARVEGATIMTVLTDTVVVTAPPLVTVLALAAEGLDETSPACVEAGELGDLEEAMELKMETGVTLEMEEVVGLKGVEGEAAEEDGETKRSAVLPEGVGAEEDGEEDGEEGFKTEIGGGLELTVVLEVEVDVRAAGVVDATIVVVLAAAAVIVVVVVPPSRSGNRVGPFVLVEVMVKIVAGTTVV